MNTAAIVFSSATAPLGGHLWHILLLGAWPPIFGIVVLVERARTRSQHAGQRLAPGEPVVVANPRATWRQAMALASVCAAVVHAAVMPEHFDQSLWYGLFFLVAALGQLGFGAIVLAKPSQRLAIAGVAGSTLVVVFWLVTRTVGVPIGPDHGAIEPFGLLDVLASICEVTAAAFGVLAIRSWTERPAWRWSQWSAALRIVAPICVAAMLVASIVSPRT